MSILLDSLVAIPLLPRRQARIGFRSSCDLDILSRCVGWYRIDRVDGYKMMYMESRGE